MDAIVILCNLFISDIGACNICVDGIGCAYEDEKFVSLLASKYNQQHA